MTFHQHFDKDDGIDVLRMMPQRLRRVVEDEGIRGRVVMLCAEPGMGKLSLAMGVMDYWARRGAWTKHRSLFGKTSAQATKSLRELADIVAGHADATPHPVVVVDQVPAADECDVERQAEAIQRMADAGCLVLACLCPEAEQLMEEVPYAVRLRTTDLLSSGRTSTDETTRSFTHGIPALVDACAGAEEASHAQSETSAIDRGEYRLELASLVESCLRHTLTDEERRTRLAMLLLGSGTVEAVSAVVDRLDEDTLDWMEREVPLLGVDCVAGTFSCAGVSLLEGLRCCCAALKPACEQMADVVLRSTKVLAGSGNVRRAALICGLCAPTDFAEVGCEWGVEFVCAGQDALVHKALEARLGLGMPPTEACELSSFALSVVCDPASSRRRATLPPARAGERTSSQARRRRYAELLQACRDVDRGVEPGNVRYACEGDDELALAFVDHLQARTLLLEGRFCEAHALLVDNVARRSPDTLVGALLCDDYEVARVMMGEEPTVEDRAAFCGARATFARMHADRLRRYHEALERLLAVVAARADHASFVEVIVYAERAGDQAVRAAMLVAAAVADVRLKAYENAHVHALHVMDMASGAATDYLVDVATLIDALVQAHLDDDVLLCDLARSRRPSVVADLALLATSRSDEGAGSVRLEVLSRTSNPKDELWLLNVLLNDFEEDEATQSFRRNAPRTWAALSRGAVRRAEKFLRMIERESLLVTPRDVRTDEPRLARGSRLEARGSRLEGGGHVPRIEVRILGGLEVLFDGEAITARLSRRMVKPYLLLLAAARGHELGMFEIIESLWPGVDIASGRQRVYNANCELRRAVNYRENGLNPIVNNRGEGVIRLDRSIVSVDADEFERAAYRALREPGDDQAVIGRTGEAATLYGGDVAASHYDAHGLVRARRDELRGLFVDVTVAGSSAALREGRLSQATRLARAAHEIDDLREDVVLALVEALKASGRNSEACATYDAYSEQLLSEEGRPPSPRLRRLVEDIYHADAPLRGRFAPIERNVRLLLA